MTKLNLMMVFEEEILVPRSEHEDRIKELVSEIYKHTFAKSDLKKMSKSALKSMAWVLGDPLQITTKSEAINDILKMLN